ncbi:hypothetical protein AB2B41_06985 [Marimonas sp. MJW-29]|uniref:Sigma-70, region 4 n=1 Tax=Sulfitobacter sediminis TaxID=3234186 RepID=A0ABV3RK45_9RHOB
MSDRHPTLLRQLKTCGAVGNATPGGGRMYLSRRVIEDMHRLGPAPKSLLDHFVAEGLTDAQIAERVGIPTASVATLCRVWSIRSDRNLDAYGEEGMVRKAG